MIDYTKFDVFKLSRRQKVLLFLIIQRDDGGGKRIFRQVGHETAWIESSYREIYEINTKEVGGSAGFMRRWELENDHNVPCAAHIHKYNIAGESKSAWVYRLQMTPEDVKAYDWTPAFIGRMTGYFTPDGWISKPSPKPEKVVMRFKQGDTVKPIKRPKWSKEDVTAKVEFLATNQYFVRFHFPNNEITAYYKDSELQ
jgi:hypothetical protein